MFTDELRDKVWNEIRQHDVRAFAKQLTPGIFAEAASRANVKIGRSALNLVNLAWLGIAKAIHHSATFAFVLTSTLKLLEDQKSFYSTPVGKQKANSNRAKQRCRKGRGGKKSKHNPHGDDPTQVTEEAFAQARQRMPMAFWAALLTILAERFQQDHSRHCLFRGFRLLAMDGTTLKLPRAEALCQYYGTPKNGTRTKAAPQARMVMLTLPDVRIPIAYEVAPIGQSEIELAMRLVDHVQARDLALIDRGFISYGLFWALQRRGAFFGTRLKKNLKYKTVKALAPKDSLVEWRPKDSCGKWKQLGLEPSIRLRVIHYQIPGFRPSAIVTNVLDPQRLSREDWVRLAGNCDQGQLKPGLYHRRWEIETSFRELKVVLHTKSLRSRTPASVEYELAGRVVDYLLIRWLIVQAAETHAIEPLRISFTNAVRELEAMRPTLLVSDERWVKRELMPRLLDRIASHLVALRPGRHYPRPNDTQPKDRGNGQKQTASKISTRVNTNRKNNKRQRPRQA
jgi:hypothetical protein